MDFTIFRRFIVGEPNIFFRICTQSQIIPAVAASESVVVVVSALFCVVVGVSPLLNPHNLTILRLRILGDPELAHAAATRLVAGWISRELRAAASPSPSQNQLIRLSRRHRAAAAAEPVAAACTLARVAIARVRVAAAVMAHWPHYRNFFSIQTF